MLYIGFWFTNLIWDISSEMRGFFPTPPPPPPLLPTSLCTDLSCWSGAPKALLPQDVCACPGACPHAGHALAQLPECALVGLLGNCRLWVEGIEFSLLHLCDLPIWSWKFGEKGWWEDTLGAWLLSDLVPLGSCLSGLFSLGPRLPFMIDKNRTRKWESYKWKLN